MWDGTLRSIHATVDRIDREDGTARIHRTPYRTGLRKRQSINNCVNYMLKQDVIRPRHSAWSSPVVVVPKKNGKPRFSVDYRRLNAIIKECTNPIPKMDDCLDSLGDAHSSRPSTAPRGTRTYPYGLTNERRRPSPATTVCSSRSSYCSG